MRIKAKALLVALALGVTAMTTGLTWAGSPAPADDERGAGSPPTDSSDPAARRHGWQAGPWPACGHPLQSMQGCYSAAARDAEAMGNLVTGTPVRCEHYETRLEAERAAQQVLQASGGGKAVIHYENALYQSGLWHCLYWVCVPLPDGSSGDKVRR